MTIVRVGANKKFSQGWETAFGKKSTKKSGDSKAGSKGPKKPAVKKSAKPTKAKKKTGKK